MAACRDETDLKRETSRKLKEEVIDNDRLTLANLNRIKQLEAQLAEISAQLDEQVRGRARGRAGPSSTSRWETLTLTLTLRVSPARRAGEG